MKKQNGITLIALVITIVVLLILAGVSMAMVLGDNGILSKAKESKTAMNDATTKEYIANAITYVEMEGLQSSSTIDEAWMTSTGSSYFNTDVKKSGVLTEGAITGYKNATGTVSYRGTVKKGEDSEIKFISVNGAITLNPTDEAYNAITTPTTTPTPGV